MKKRDLSKIALVSLVSFFLGGLILLTVSKIRQEQPIAPTAPQSNPQALEGAPVPACVYNFAINQPTPSPSSGVPSPSASPLPCLALAKEAVPICVGNTSTASITLHVNGACPPVSSPLPLDIMLALDTSSSMDDISTNPPQPLTDTKNAAKLLIDQLNGTRDRIGLATFGTSSILRIGLTSNLNAVKTSIDTAPITPGTNIGGGIRTAQAELLANGRPNAVKILVVLSDGQPNTNSSTGPCAGSSNSSTSAICEANQAKTAGSTVFSIALRNNVSNSQWATIENLMRQIASSTSNYYGAPTAAALANIFTSIGTTIVNTLATNAVITDILPPGLHLIPGSAVPGQTTVSGQTLTWNLGSVSVNQSATVTFNVTFDSLAPNQLADVFPNSGVSYNDQFGNPTTLPFPQTFVSPLACGASASPSPSVTPQPTPSASPSPSPSPSAIPSPTPVPTPTPTATPLPTPFLRCTAVNIYRDLGGGQWQLVSDTHTLVAGDTIIFAVMGSTNTSTTDIDMAQFRITAGGVVGPWQQTTNFNILTGQFYITYTLLPGISSYSVEAQVHHVNLGWE